MENKKIERLLKRFKHKCYRPKTYFDLDLENRKRLVDDFSAATSIIYDLNQARLAQKGWIKAKEPKQFYKGFEPFWLTHYILSEYFKVLGSNRIIDTFLNDPREGKRGSLADLRQKVFNPNNIRKIIVSNKRARKEDITDALKLISDCPISKDVLAISLRKYLKYKLLYIWMPIQVFFAKILPHKHWPWKKGRFITQEQLDDLFPYLQFGDILIQRTNFALTNATLIGFWTHAMIYDGKGYIFEATPSFVRKVFWKETAWSDYLAVLRPKSTKKEKEKAVSFAKSQVGKKYDFNFDFLSDEGLVCSELVLKSYPLLKPKMQNFFGRLAFPTSNFVDLFNEGKLDLIYFLDGRQFKNRAVLGTAKEFSTSNLRSKWDLLQK